MDHETDDGDILGFVDGKKTLLTMKILSGLDGSTPWLKLLQHTNQSTAGMQVQRSQT
jgi:hypothetical protein